MSESGLGAFLAAAGLGEWAWALEKEAVTLDSLLLLTEADLAQMALPLGIPTAPRPSPRRERDMCCRAAEAVVAGHLRPEAPPGQPRARL